MLCVCGVLFLYDLFRKHYQFVWRDYISSIHHRLWTKCWPWCGHSWPKNYWTPCICIKPKIPLSASIWIPSWCPLNMVARPALSMRYNVSLMKSEIKQRNIWRNSIFLLFCELESMCVLLSHSCRKSWLVREQHNVTNTYLFTHSIVCFTFHNAYSFRIVCVRVCA